MQLFIPAYHSKKQEKKTSFYCHFFFYPYKRKIRRCIGFSFNMLRYMFFVSLIFFFKSWCDVCVCNFKRRGMDLYNYYLVRYCWCVFLLLLLLLLLLCSQSLVKSRYIHIQVFLLTCDLMFVLEIDGGNWMHFPICCACSCFYLYMKLYMWILSEGFFLWIAVRSWRGFLLWNNGVAYNLNLFISGFRVVHFFLRGVSLMKYVFFSGDFW